MACQACGVEAPTKYVEFYQNIGALVMHFSKAARGNFCKSCIHKYFWKFTLINLSLGWWGLHSLIITPIFVVNNVGRYLACLRMEPVPPGAANLVLTSDAIAKLNPFQEPLLERLDQGEKLDLVISDIAHRAGVTPVQVALYLRAMAKAQAKG